MTTLKDIIDEGEVDLERFNQLFKQVSNYSRLIGTRYLEIRRGYAKAEAHYKEELARSGGILHGGAIMGMLDEVSGVAAATVNPGEEQVTIELKINFMRPLHSGNSPYILEGEVLRSGRTTIVVMGRIYDSEGKLSAVSIGTWYILYDRSKARLKG